MNETAVKQRTQLAFANIGPIWRNNSGAFKDETGRMIRYGLCNDSAQLNKLIKSSDLIGITPVMAFLASTGQWHRLGVFTALEIKETGWHPTPSDERAIAQAKFHDIVREAGGFAGFVNDPVDIHSIIRQS